MSISRKSQLCFPAAALLALAASQALAADISVDGTTCTLSDAITAANTNADTGGCSSGNGTVTGTYGNDIIILNNYITLASALPNITSPLTISNSWWGYSIDGNQEDFPVLTVASTGDLTLNGVTVQGANHVSGSGGGIYNDGGKVTVEGSSSISSNIANIGGGIYNLNGTVVIKPDSSSAVSSNSASYGGGIYNDGGTVTVKGYHAVSGNSATGYGGGILNTNGGTLLVKNAGIEYNSSSIDGGGIYSDSGTVTVESSLISANSAASGGGLYFSGGTVTLNNTTVSGNTANTTLAGIAMFGAGLTATLNNCTVSQNTASGASGTGGINAESSALVTLRSSIVSGNTGDGTCDEVFDNGSGTFVVDSYNVFGHDGNNDATAYCGGFAPGANDVNATTGDGSATGTALTAILNTSLATNNGTTETHALPVGSPAIDLGPLNQPCPGGVYADQRGFNRPINFSCDAGAYEYSASTSVASSGNGHDLPANIWLMSALSSSPFPTSLSTVYNELGTYGTNWTAFKWDAASQTYGSALLGTYNPAIGEGAWLYSLNAATLVVGGTATTTTADCSIYGWAGQTCRAINLTPAPNASTEIWQMVGHVFPYTVDWADVRVATSDGTTWTTYTPSEAEAANRISRTWQRYNGSGYTPYNDSTPGMIGTLRPQESFWVRIKSGSSGLSAGNFKLLIPAR